MSKLYSVLMYNFNNYEIMREPEEIDPDAEYVYVTDFPANYESKYWNIKYDSKLDNMSVFDKCYYVRFHPFEYVSTDTIIYLDGSNQIHKSLRPIINLFNNGNYDAAYALNLWYHRLVQDYYLWVSTRNYPIENANKCLSYLHNIGNWDFEYKGYLELYFRIIRNTKFNTELDTMTYHILRELGTPTEIERFDQPIYAYVLQKYFSNLKILPFSRQIVTSQYISRCLHNSTKIEDSPINGIHTAWLFNKEVNIIEM